MLDFNKEIQRLKDLLKNQLEEKHPQTDQCGFDRNGSHSMDCYVCTCGWSEKREGDGDGAG